MRRKIIAKEFGVEFRGVLMPQMRCLLRGFPHTARGGDNGNHRKGADKEAVEKAASRRKGRWQEAVGRKEWGLLVPK